MSDGTPLGALLIDEGFLTEAQLDAALAEQARSGKPLGRLLIEQGTISEADLVRTLARQVGLEFVDLDDRTHRRSVAVAGRPSRSPAGTRRSRSAGRTASSSSRWPTRRTSSRSTTSAPSPAPRSTPSSRPRARSSRRSSASTAWTARSTRSCRPRPTRPTRRPISTRSVGGRRGRADRQVRQPAHQPGRRTTARRDIHVEPTETRPAHPLPHRRRAARGDALAAQHPGRRDQPPQGHGRHQHRRAPHPAGRPHRDEGRRPQRSTCASRPCRPCTARRS